MYQGCRNLYGRVSVPIQSYENCTLLSKINSEFATWQLQKDKYWFFLYLQYQEPGIYSKVSLGGNWLLQIFHLGPLLVLAIILANKHITKKIQIYLTKITEIPSVIFPILPKLRTTQNYYLEPGYT